MLLDESICKIRFKYLCEYSHKNKYRWNYPYSQLLTEKIGLEIYKQYLVTRGITKKCIVLDCDNVLWGGVLSEEGTENIKLASSGFGKQYRDFQRFLLMLHNHGIILTVCSKNDESDVLKVFKKHSGMVLKEENIALFRVNWDAKAENIRDIAATLNIGLDSIVFIDDSDFEIGAIRSVLPEVTTVQYKRDSVYEALSCFNLKRDVDATGVKQRHDAYKTDEYRRKLKKHSQTFDEYLASLDMKIDIHEATPIEYARISELTQRTNRMTNGIRYTVEELKAYVTKTEYIVARCCCSGVRLSINSSMEIEFSSSKHSGVHPPHNFSLRTIMVFLSFSSKERISL